MSVFEVLRSLISTCTLSFIIDVFSTECSNLNFKPCCRRILWNLSDTSESIPFKTLGKNSITSTSEPNLLQTVPNSNPITPAPITITFLGTDFKSKAPVEVTIFCSSILILFKFEGSEPVAMIIFSAKIFSVLPFPLI